MIMLSILFLISTGTIFLLWHLCVHMVHGGVLLVFSWTFWVILDYWQLIIIWLMFIWSASQSWSELFHSVFGCTMHVLSTGVWHHEAMFVLPFCNSGSDMFSVCDNFQDVWFVASSAEELFKFCPGTYRCVCAGEGWRPSWLGSARLAVTRTCCSGGGGLCGCCVCVALLVTVLSSIVLILSGVWELANNCVLVSLCNFKLHMLSLIKYITQLGNKFTVMIHFCHVM
jgi:hypothetical protein